MMKNWTKSINLSTVAVLVKKWATKHLLAASFLAGLLVLPVGRPFTYTVNGNPVVRPSELGPLMGTVEKSPLAFRPGHDFGAIGNEPGLTVILPPTRPFAYVVNGDPVAGRSELGPLTGTVVASPLVFRPGHDFGAIENEPGLAVILPTPRPFTYTVNGDPVIRSSELGPLN
jgi:hypothetical protein